MGFFVATLTEQVRVHPSYFGPNLRHELVRQLLIRVEGTILGELGFIVAVVVVEEPLPHGFLEDPLFGFASFDVVYRAVVLRPFKNEIVNAVVTRPVPSGFYATVGPMNLFVVHHNIPSMQFDPTKSAWKPIGNDFEDEVIKEKTVVRLRLMTVALRLKEITVVGNMTEQYMGVVDVE